MRKFFSYLTVCLMVLIFCNLSFAQGQQQPQQVQAAPTTTDEGTPVFDGELIIPKFASEQKIEIKLIEDFESLTGGQWNARMPSDQGLAIAKIITGSPKAVGGQKCLTVKEWGYCRGFNWTDITPPTPIAIPGSCKAISVWAYGLNYKHKLEAWVKSENTGIEYLVDLGSLDFKGWKRMSALVPAHVKQYSKYYPNYKPLYFTRFLIRHDPDEKAGVFYLSLDNLEAACDMYVDPSFDGSDMFDEVGIHRFEVEMYNDSVQKSTNK